MASSVMTEAILIIASIVVATTIAGVVMSQVGSFESTFTATSQNQKNEMLTKIKVIHVLRNATDSPPNLEVWVKNIGIDPITAPTSMDIYFGPTGAAQRIPYNAAGGEDTWRFQTLPNMIQKMDTVQIRITDSQLTVGTTYTLRVAAPNGVYTDYVFST
ncbi:MAG: flagellin [Candidatus Nitrosotenuis sp.]|uniref:Putative flagellar protein FlaG n=1 Tax=Candidatus Nitrosotenuis uzonensis TaxID=1407055 RepID=A0A812F083_9ARCH|nr:flagellin [Candidatus Nitrosotenuis uzonensis]CAE6491804.1 putative flagellar protein FlaG [Candidatus Nitrosotenuis uzonensis]